MAGFPHDEGESESLPQPTNPEYFGYLGWALDPTLAAAGNNDVAGIINLMRFVCVVSGTCESIAYYVNGAGSSETPGQNWIGIYDTGQATEGVATLLGQTADQTDNFGNSGLFTPALTSEVPLTAGQDYFFALLENNTGSAPEFPVLFPPAAPFVNVGLSGLGYRLCDVLGPSTSLPATIAEADLDITQAAAVYSFIALP